MLPGDYLLDYLLTTSIDPAERERLSQQQQAIVEEVQLLAQEFSELQPLYEDFDAYYRGHPPMPAEPTRMTSRFQSLQDMSSSPWCGLVVDVVDERLVISSIRSKRFPIKDERAWKWWQANNMDMHASQVHVAALVFGLCYVSVWPAEKPDSAPLIMGESPLSSYVAYDANQNPTAAVRFYQDRRKGIVYCDFTRDDYQFRLEASGHLDRVTRIYGGHAVDAFDLTSAQWVFRQDEPIRVNTMRRVPYVRLRTKPDLLGGCQSEIEAIRRTQDRIHKTIFDRVVCQEFAAFPQRHIAGIETRVDPTTGEPKLPFDAAIDRIWTADDPAVTFGQFEPADLKPYLDSVTADVQALATQSRTPPHYLIAGMGVFPSGESVRATEYGLTRKVAARQGSYGDGWGDVYRLAALAAGNTELADDDELAPVWGNVEPSSESERADALLKLSTIPGMPTEALVARSGLDPELIDVYREQSGKPVVAQQSAASTNVPAVPAGEPISGPA